MILKNIYKKKNRKLNRLKNYDHSQKGSYFVTICIKNREEILGEIENNKLILNRYGKTVNNFWLEIPNHYKNVQLDEFIIMPNHMHGIVIIDNNNVGTEQCSVPTMKRYGLLSKIIKSFKEMSVKSIKKGFNKRDFVWQRSFYDSVIRTKESLINIRRYIINNPKM